MVLLILVTMLASGAGNNPARPGKKAEPGADFFSEPAIRTFRFEVPEAALNQLRQSPRSYVTGKVIEDGHVLTNVAFRLRGHGSFRSLEEKPNLAVNFREFATNQTYRGLKKLMFNNSVQDETRMAEFLSTQLFRDAGLPAARVTHARVQLNGRDLGLYVVIEAMGREFLKQHFQNPNGSLYEGGPDIDSTLEQDSGVRGDQSDRAKLARACALTNGVERWQALGRVLDVDRFVSFAALEMLTAHWDGYVLHLNNYRLYHDPTAGRFEFIPHGMDWAFLRPNLSIQVPQRSVVAHALFDSREGQKLYRERVGMLFTNVFRFATITNRIEREMAKIRTGDFAANELAAIERGAVLVRERVRLRMIRISNELAAPGPTFLKFETNGVAALTEWRADHDGGTGAVDRVTVDDRTALHIGAARAAPFAWGTHDCVLWCADWVRTRGGTPGEVLVAPWIEPFDQLIIEDLKTSDLDPLSRGRLEGGELVVASRVTDPRLGVYGLVQGDRDKVLIRLSETAADSRLATERNVIAQHALILVTALAGLVLVVLGRETPPEDTGMPALRAYEEAMSRMRRRDDERLAAFDREKNALTSILRDREAMARAGELTAGIVHEVRNSMGAIAAQAMMLGASVPATRGSFMSLNTAVQHLATGIAPVIAGEILARSPDGFATVGWVSAGTASSLTL